MRLVRFLDTTTTALGPNRVEAIAGTSKKARDGHVVEMRGMDASAFLRSGTILWNHEPDRPVGIPVAGRVDSAGDLRLTIDFAPDGASRHADEIRGLVKSGIIRNMSIGFSVIDAQPLDPKDPRGGMRVSRSELLEVSFCSVPADVGAVVTARAARAGKVLSGLNSEKLREAHAHADRCLSAIGDVLSGAGESISGVAGAEQDRAFRQRQAAVLELGAPVFHVSADFERRQRQLDALKLSAGAQLAADLDRQMRQAAARRLMIPAVRRG